MKQWEDGTHVEVFVAWSKTDSAHVFVAENRDRKS